MAKKSKYADWTKEELLKRVDALEKRKKYGLVWDEERTKERFEAEAEGKLPILKEIKSKDIKTDASQPTHILIEGDNYHTLSVLAYTHEKKVDVIYIDPPYNTGDDDEWRFNDSWVDKNDAYRHSKWLSFISKRLCLAKPLLKSEGVILISIDDNEYAQLRLLCDGIFGEGQYVGSLVWEKKKKGSHLDSALTNVKEYILVYSKDRAAFSGLIGEVKKEMETYPCINPGNGYSTRTIPAGINSKYRKNKVSLPEGHTISSGNMSLRLLSPLEIENKILKRSVIVEAEWRYDQNSIDKYASSGELYFTQDLYLRRIVRHPRHKKLKGSSCKSVGKNLWYGGSNILISKG